ncbi:MAG: type IV pilus assembly protein FimV [Gammaproteobacteria bacterium]
MALAKNQPFFIAPNEGLFNFVDQDPNHYLDGLVHEIKRKPARLITHIRRIYWCYGEQLTEHLFAALVDFLIVLNHRGKAISNKMVLGARSRLTPEQQKLLSDALINTNNDASLLSGNRFSVFSKGLIGKTELIEKSHDTAPSKHDPLQLAEDAVQYSQLDEAMSILENAIREQPDRLPLHHSLLELYRSTSARSRFEKLAAELAATEDVMPDEWKTLKDYFEGNPN